MVLRAVKYRSLSILVVGVLNVGHVCMAGLVRQGTSTCLCVAVKRSILVYEINRTRQRHRRVKEIQCPGAVQFIEMVNERLVVGYPSSFAIYSVQGDAAPIGLFLLNSSLCVAS